MAVDKFSVSLDPDLAKALREAAEEEDVTVSAWMAEAARQRLRNLTLGIVLDEIIAEQGWDKDELLREAAEDDRLFALEQARRAEEERAAEADAPARRSA